MPFAECHRALPRPPREKALEVALAPQLEARGDRGAPAPTAAPFGYSLVKRTHATADANDDARFLHEFFGLAITFNQTYTQPDGVCATRIILACLPNFEIHLFESRVAPDGARALVVTINHPVPFFDDSYAVDSANVGPYGTAIMRELLPAVEKKYRGIGEGWARGVLGGSTGGWEAFAVQVLCT